MSEREAEGSVTRRRFIGLTSATAAGIGIAPFFGSAPESLAAASASSDDYYAKLGVEKIINAAGTYTYLTAACMPPQVQRAVAQAALHPVRLKDLQLAAGEYLAKKLRCEAAMVTAGASAALTLATAACIASANGASPQEIPENVDKMKNEVVVQKAHRYEYDHPMLLCGARIKEVVTLEDYKRALSPNTVMTNFFNAAEAGPNGAQIDRETWLSVAHEHGVPCHNDAAADMPPIENLWKYTGMGFDLVAFSGGKGIRGPQNAGLLLGKKHLIDLATANNNPNSDAVGRGMKVAKEQIVGMVAAVDWLLEQSDETCSVHPGAGEPRQLGRGRGPDHPRPARGLAAAWRSSAVSAGSESQRRPAFPRRPARSPPRRRPARTGTGTAGPRCPPCWLR